MLLTIGTCGKNDDYAGNFVHRLELCLNKLISNIDALSLQNEVEILVTDWGSDEGKRLSDVCNIPSRDYLKFIYVPTETTTRLVTDSKFSTPHAVNTAARRMSGDNFMWIDGDTYIPLDAFKGIIDILNSKPEYVYYWASRYMIPYKLQANVSNIDEMELLIQNWKFFGKPLVSYEMCEHGFHHNTINLNYFMGCACALLLQKSLVLETTLLCEKFTKWGWMDIDLYRRLQNENYLPLGDLETVLGCEFYHIGHHEVAAGHQINGMNHSDHCGPIRVNGDDWGLANENLEVYTKK